MIDLLSATAVLGLAGLLCWLITDSDDDNSGGGLMQRHASTRVGSCSRAPSPNPPAFLNGEVIRL